MFLFLVTDSRITALPQMHLDQVEWVLAMVHQEVCDLDQDLYQVSVRLTYPNHKCRRNLEEVVQGKSSLILRMLIVT
jgi:hypothetical protein